MNREKFYNWPALPPDSAQDQGYECKRQNQLCKSGKVIPIHVRPKRESSGAYLAKPVELSIRCHVLEDGEDTDQETENHSAPHETPPIFQSPKGLNRGKKNDQVGQDK